MTPAKSDVHGRYFITPVQILERFMLTGSLAPKYTANDKFADFPADTFNAINTIFQCFPEEAFDKLVEVITLFKAPRKPPVLLALACALGIASLKGRAEIVAQGQASTGTDMFVLTKMLVDLGRGGGRSFKRQVNTLYRHLDDAEGRDKLAMNLVKFRNRAGWTHRDLLRVGHYKPSKANNDLFKWVVGKGPATHPLIAGFEEASRITSDLEAIKLLHRDPKLPWEAFPTEVLGSASVWIALLPNLGNSALIRNLGRMSSLGIDLSPYTGRIMAACRNLHPVAALSAWKTYSQGKGLKGSLVWRASPEIISALEAGFYASFGNLKKSDAKVFFGLDISGSMMTNQSTVAGLNCREVAAAMVMVAMKQQPYMVYGFSNNLIPLEIRDDWNMTQVMQYMHNIPFGSTDCSLPIRFCNQNAIRDVDLFAIYTDNETNQRNKPSDALNEYRRNINPHAKLATVALMGGAFSIADPNDPGQVDFVGFDPSVPSVMVSLAEQRLV